MSNIVEITPTRLPAAPGMDIGTSVIFDPERFNRCVTLAEMMAKSDVITPAHLRGKPADCFALVMQALQWRMPNPFVIASKTYTVKEGAPLAYEAQLIDAVVNQNAPINGRLDVEWFGDWDRIAGRVKEIAVQKTGKNGTYTQKQPAPDWTPAEEDGLGIVVRADIQGLGIREHRLMLRQAQPRNSTLWVYNPKIQISYLAKRQWARIWMPDVLLGVYTPDEIQPEDYDSAPPPASAARESLPKPQQNKAGLTAVLAAAGGNIGKPAPALDWQAWAEEQKKQIAATQSTADLSQLAKQSSAMLAQLKEQDETLYESIMLCGMDKRTDLEEREAIAMEGA